MVGQLGGRVEWRCPFLRLAVILVAVQVTRSTSMTSHLLKMETDAIATSKNGKTNQVNDHRQLDDYLKKKE